MKWCQKQNCENLIQNVPCIEIYVCIESSSNTYNINTFLFSSHISQVHYKLIYLYYHCCWSNEILHIYDMNLNMNSGIYIWRSFTFKGIKKMLRRHVFWYLSIVLNLWTTTYILSLINAFFGLIHLSVIVCFWELWPKICINEKW